MELGLQQVDDKTVELLEVKAQEMDDKVSILKIE